ncbi:MAG: glycosyltransferase family 2 protein [Candidatus Limnocylindrales bacterium]
MARISGVVIALNEAHQLHYALSTLTPWCDEVIVVDQHSEDDTARIAEELGASVYQHERTGGIADPARRFAVGKATGDWVFILDADEMVPPTLATHLRALVEPDPEIDVVLIPRANIILGRWIRHGNNWPSRHARFFRPGSLLMTDRIHNSIVPAPGTRRHKLAADPALAIWHFPGGNLSDLVRKVDRYTDIEARQAYARGRRVNGPLDLFGDATRYFWRQYVRGRGYRDGTLGLAVAITRTYYRVLTAAKLFELPRAAARREEVRLVRERLLGRWAAAPRSEAATGPDDA